MTRIPFQEMKTTIKQAFLKAGMPEDRADTCAQVHTASSCDGVYSHGLNRVERFVEYIGKGWVDVHAAPSLDKNLGALEIYNGNMAPGILNAQFAMNRATEIAAKNGLGLASLNNTTHWMRGGTYGWQAADAGCLAICFTNTIANMPPWGGIDPRLGNNPLVIAVPKKGGHVVLDMAMSQFAYGKLQSHKANNNEPLPLPGGYDEEGNLSTDAAAIIQSKRMLPAGFWKGSGLSLMLDLLTTILSNGNSTEKITDSGMESGVSQVFICIHQPDAALMENITQQIIGYTKTSRPDKEGGEITYPGENTLRTRERNLKEGIPVNEAIWNKVLSL